jgi:SnoaL-like domain
MILLTSDEVGRRLDALESEGAIRRLMANYIELRDFGGDAASIAGLFTPSGVWEHVGRLAPVLGAHHGREAIARRFSGPLPLSRHFLTNEAIMVKGETAVGMWSYVMASVVEEQVVWTAGRYRNDFVRVEGAWRFQLVRIEDIALPSTADGWLKTRGAP